MNTLERIKKMKADGMSYFEIASVIKDNLPGEMEVHPNTIYNWVTGKHGIRDMTKFHINQALDKYEGGSNEKGYSQLDRR